METKKQNTPTDKNKAENAIEPLKKPYKKPESKTHEPLEVISAYRDRSSELVF